MSTDPMMIPQPRWTWDEAERTWRFGVEFFEWHPPVMLAHEGPSGQAVLESLFAPDA